MLKLTLILFLLLFTARSVSSLECYVTDPKACEGMDREEYHKCLDKNHKKQKCEPPNDLSCARSHILKEDYTYVDVTGCSARRAGSDTTKICQELLAPYGHKVPVLGEWKSMQCVTCDKDNCNEPNIPKKMEGVTTTQPKLEGGVTTTKPQLKGVTTTESKMEGVTATIATTKPNPQPKQTNSAPSVNFFACQCSLIIFTIVLKIDFD